MSAVNFPVSPGIDIPHTYEYARISGCGAANKRVTSANLREFSVVFTQHVGCSHGMWADAGCVQAVWAAYVQAGVGAECAQMQINAE